jgi:hypothetical protein
MTYWKTAASARHRTQARLCRRLALTLATSDAKAAMARLARRWELIAAAEDAAPPANEP